LLPFTDVGVRDLNNKKKKKKNPEKFQINPITGQMGVTLYHEY